MPTDGILSAGMGDGLGVVVGRLDDPQFRALDEIIKINIASEETDVNVMF